MYEYFRKEAQQKDRFSPAFYKDVKKVQKGIAAATGVLQSAIYRILLDKKNKQKKEHLWAPQERLTTYRNE